MRKILLLTGIVFATVWSSTQAQGIDSLLNKLETQYPQEKLYLHYDKNAYNPGETIWIKAYLTAANMLSNISKNVYTELVDGKGKVLQRKITPVVMAGAATSVDIPASFADTVVYVRAYTSWMLNFDPDFLYSKAIPVISKTPPAKKTVAPNPGRVTFFPEGGDLIEGLPSRVAFRFEDTRGLPLALSGEVQSSKGESIAKFKSVHDGLGYFDLTPQPGETYTALWKDAAGKPQKTTLPAARPQGIVLEVSNTASGIQFTVKRRPDAPAELQALQIVAQEQQQMVYQAKLNMAKTESVRAAIPTDNLASGIVQLTVLTHDNKPLAERIVFVNHQDYYFITDVNAQVKGLDKRAKNVIQVDVPDTIVCNLSIAITDAGLNPAQPQDEDIYSHILLTGDLKGYIHNPGYYFSSEADSVQQHLDLVMMSNGWRRFKWEDVVAQKWPAIKYMPDNYVSVVGNISGLNKSELVQREITGILVMKSEGQDILQIPVSREGKFGIEGMLFYDTAKLYYQFADDKNKVLTDKAVFDIKNSFINQISIFKPDSNQFLTVPRFSNDVLTRNRDMNQMNTLLADSKLKVKTLQGVTVTAKGKSKKDQLDEQYTSGLFRGGDGYTFITEDDPSAVGSMTVLQYLQGKVAGLNITGAGTNMSMSWRGGTPSLFYNEMPGDVQLIQNLNMNDVAMIKVFRPPFFGAMGGGSGGAIAVYTKKGAANKNDNVKGLNFAKIAGYVPEKQFFSPDYSKLDEPNNEPDNRTTLYWNPTIYTDKNSRRNFYTFYNNDVTRKIRVVIEGVNAEGKLTHSEKIY
ncbi:hypothetical protein [Flavihumibacter petaseus]|uniref:TonB-dependent receptor n=1 Tax=Flavihumibacter petaseus NBRC 106054 TaxID=1220578 RepID=A0A0E9MWN2_9BACT|nr:hypothetical protein [Flavihumibacter petaseus]GAO42157.1 hypothetical protein FPE01S_01_11700 [Flavihumibacter petaseus NBRC 106054]